MKRTVTKFILCASSFTILAQAMSIVVSANQIQESNIGQGLLAILNDSSNFMMVLGPTIGSVSAGIFAIRRGMADEQDGKMWQKRIVVAIICGVGCLLVGGVIKLIVGYFI